MNEQLGWLVALQKKDLRKKEISRLRETLPLELERLTKELDGERERVKNAQQRLQELKLKRRMKEKDLEAQTEKVKRSQGRLLEVKTNKEYQALLKEIELGKEANSALEEEILLLMEEMDQLEDDLDRMQSELRDREASTKQRKDSIEKQLGELEEEDARCDQQREDILRHIDSHLITQYERISSRNNGVAVAKVLNGVCQGCFVNIPPQLYNEILKSGSVIQCPFCQRFLYYEQGKQEAEREETTHQRGGK